MPAFFLPMDMKLHRYVYAAMDVLRDYTVDLPLQHHLRHFFRENGKYGSRDRKWIRELCYAYFRTGERFSGLSLQERILFSFFLVHQVNERFASEIVAPLPIDEPDFSQERSVKLKRLQELTPILLTKDAFSFEGNYSASLDAGRWMQALNDQPKVWLRVNNGFHDKVFAALNEASIPFIQHPELPFALSLPPGLAVDKTPVIEKGWAEVQDLSSQKTLLGLRFDPHAEWLDACTASGGKSLLLLAMQANVRLTVSDNRATMLENLRERFARCGVKNYTAIVHDWTTGNPFGTEKKFDGILADVPCTGSGTWARTPEQMAVFSMDKLNAMVQLQRSILQSLLPLLKPGGCLIYITCSVFAAENEDQREWLQENGLQLLDEQLFQGSTENADTLYRLVLRAT